MTQQTSSPTTIRAMHKNKPSSSVSAQSKLSASRVSSSMFRKSQNEKSTSSPKNDSTPRQDYVSVESLRLKLSQNLFSSEKKKKEEEEAGYSLLRQSFEKINAISPNTAQNLPTPSPTHNHSTHFATSKLFPFSSSNNINTLPSGSSQISPIQQFDTLKKSMPESKTARSITKDGVSIPSLQLGKTAREETDTFVRGFQYIERLNKRAKSAGYSRSNLSSSRTTHNSGFFSSRSIKSSIPQESKLSAEKLSQWENYENKREEEAQHEAVISSTLEPLRLQYDPSQIRMSPVSLVNSHGGNNSKKNMIKDMKMMAEACSRAGRLKMEGLIHYKIANKYEELGEDQSAIPHYERFLAISEGLKDEMAQCLALNCLGVLFQRMGGTDNLNFALKYHMMQWDISEPQAQVVSNINMGIIFQQLGHYENATDNYKMAYQQAHKIGDKQGESIALANLGILGKEQGDLATAQTCMEKHLSLSETLNNPVGEGEAYQQLGILASKKGEGDLAVKMLHKARNIAIQYDKKKADQISCNIGIIEGNTRFEEYMKSLGQYN
ncbi:hypothetical protein C9374_001243 [Naegleria lovaniensis]|uniref:Uncharacterized protein n=1 Tax=Naegleria lovaniensis TaxID=51637 RepID=A0AA88GXV1_NAELO|nr:uncharacterized protein C9374_001243 [Naegleria lovaniensis]KAG2387649.1 hypothetical protein C9374_001243 [Naegleria lovaniensis]